MFEAQSVMTKNVITVKPNTPIIDAVRLLVKHAISGLPVVNDSNELVGILSEKDALSLLHNPTDSATYVSDYMTPDVVKFLNTDSLVQVCQCLIKNPFRRVPIVDQNNKLCGVISRRDIMKKILEMRRVSLDETNIQGEDA